jgi:zinc protease
MRRGLLATALVVSLGCEESARFGSFGVARAPHPPYNQPAASRAASEDAYGLARPGLSPSPPFDLPPVRIATLANGVRAFTVERHTLPIAVVRAIVGRGSLGAAPGVASMAAATLLEGTKWSSSLAVHQRFLEMGATVSTAASYEAITIDLKVPAPNLRPALDIVGDLLRAPAFPADRVERAKNQVLSELARRTAQPQRLAASQLDAALYPPGHAYHEPVEGSEEALRATGVADLERFWRSSAVPLSTSFIVAGDIDDGATLGMLRRLFEDWSGAAPPALPRPPPAASAAGPQLFLVDRSGDPQCAVRLGWLVADRDSEDVPALRALALTLAQGALGRLGRLLRGERSETYGVQAMLTPRTGASEFVVAASIERDRTADALREALAEIERVRTQPVPASDALNARALLRDVAWQSLETSDDIVGALTDPVLHDPVDRIRERLLAPADARPEEVQRVAAKYLTREARRIVVVGDASRVRPSLEALGLGEIAVR